MSIRMFLSLSLGIAVLSLVMVVQNFFKGQLLMAAAWSVLWLVEVTIASAFLNDGKR
jgi:hypothetical protein